MKMARNITNSTILYAGEASQNGSNKVERNTQTAEQKAQSKEQRIQKKEAAKSLYAGSLNEDIFSNQLQQKKKEAQQKAMKVITDAWAGDRVIDEDLQARRDHVHELKRQNLDLQKKISGIEDAQEQLQKTYGITADCEEQQELELVMKSRNGMTKGALSPEELEKAAQIEKRGLTEYQQRYLELTDEKGVYQEELYDNEMTIVEENAIIRGTRMERLKHSPMVGAKNQAEEILKSASEEIIGMVMEDAKEQINHEQEERQEKAEKLEEQRKEQEQFIESQQEKRSEQEELLEDMPMEEMLQWNQSKADVKQEVQDILNKMKLVAEDIKGAMVDESL